MTARRSCRVADGPCSDYTDDGLLMGPTYPNYSFSISPTITLYNDLQIFALAEGQYGRWIASTDANYACRYYRNCLAGVERTIRSSSRVPPTSSTTATTAASRVISGGCARSAPGTTAPGPGAGSVRTARRFRCRRPTSGRSWQKTETDAAGNNIYDPEYSINGSNPQATALWEMPGIAAVNA